MLAGADAGQQPHHLELRVVRVLELVHEDDSGSALRRRATSAGMLAQQRQRTEDLVAEVDQPGLGQQR